MMLVSAWRIKFEAHHEISAVQGVTSVAKDVHFHLVDHCNIDTLRCFPSEKRLARLIGKTERSVRSALKQLEDLNVISRKRNQGRGGANQYDLHLLERKILEHRPEEKSGDHRQKSSAKQKKEQIKEKGQVVDRSLQPRRGGIAKQVVDQPLQFEIVTNVACLEKWESVIGDQNLGSAMEIMKLTFDGIGYRLPSREPRRDTESLKAIRKYIMSVVGSRGACFK